MTPEDRSWLRQFDKALSAIEKKDIGGEKGPRELNKIREKFAADDRYQELGPIVSDLMSHHRDRLIGLPVYKNDPEGTQRANWEKAKADRAARLDAIFMEA